MSTWEDLDNTSSDEDDEEANICLMVDTTFEGSESDQEDETSLIAKSRLLSWYLDSGCSWHMQGEKCMFQCLTPYDGGIITFEVNKKGKITGVSKIGIHPYPYIDIGR